MIISVCSLIPLSYGQIDELSNDRNVTSANKTSEPLTTGNATKYTSKNLGITFEYPSGWVLNENQDRKGNVTVSYGAAKFVVLKAIDRPKSSPLKSSDIAKSTRILQVAATTENATVVKATDVKKYKIGDEMTGTFVTKVNDGVSSFKLQDFFVIHGGDGYLLGFRAPTETFEEPETQNIMNKIMHSFKFLK